MEFLEKLLVDRGVVKNALEDVANEDGDCFGAGYPIGVLEEDGKGNEDEELHQHGCFSTDFFFSHVRMA